MHLTVAMIWGSGGGEFGCGHFPPSLSLPSLSLFPSFAQLALSLSLFSSLEELTFSELRQRVYTFKSLTEFEIELT